MDSINQSVLFHGYELSGFYNALRCSIGIPNRNFDATIFSKNGECLEIIIEEQINYIKEKGTFKNQKVVDYNFIETLFKSFIYDQLSELNKEQLYNLDWNLVEHYGLISTAENESGSWNRLISQKHTLLEYINENGCEAVLFFVEHDGFVVITYLAQSEPET
ncbi:hypothetical protein [Motilimonas pumila]|uniref:Uncharacterized protein n=1 Tax=Motilimonas pumila TaxID=2303987 RepID=A0A418YB22_9GAMM|nr:hypothetical protein [Motilimonas pumila]RJG40168.1 hypothetical protein D1Z90_17130 [Motilimonas pumila]